MIKISRELRLGVFGTVVIILFIVALNFVKGKDYFRKHQTYYALFRNISGLVEAAPISINGMTVGKITEIRFENPQSSRILVELTVYNPIKIPSNSIARIFSLDILGTRSIELVMGNSPVYAESGDTLTSEVQMSLTEEVNKQVAPLKIKAENLISSLDTMVTVLQTVFNAETRRNLRESFERIRSTITNLESTSFNIDTLVYGQRRRMERIFYNIETVTAALRDNTGNLNKIMCNISAISDTIARINFINTFNNLDRTLGQISDITQKINSGQGSVGMLVNNDSVYRNLEKSSAELNALIKDIKLNPYRYLNFSIFPPGNKRMEFKENK